MTSNEDPTMLLVCPACKGPLLRRSEGLSCSRCHERYPSLREMCDLRPRRCRSTGSARSVLDVGCGGGDFLLEIEERLGSRGSLFTGIEVAR